VSNSNRTIGRIGGGEGGQERLKDLRETKNDKKKIIKERKVYIYTS
jgi:hypothetical protein